MKMAIAAEIYPPDSGGPATFVARIAPILRERGIALSIITYAGSLPNESDGVVRILKQGNLLQRYWHYFKKLLALAGSADLIFAQGPVAAGLPAILVKKLTGKKVIVKVVGDVAWERSRNQGRVKEMVDEFQTHAHGFLITCHKKLRSWTLKRADLVITPSQYLKKMICGWGVPAGKIKVIYNSFEAAHRAPVAKNQAKANLSLEGDIILTVGRLASWKGFDTLINLMPEWLKLNPNFKLVIVGSGPEENNLKLKAQSLELADKVIFAGQKTQAEMTSYYQAADYFILNSGYEGLSHSLLEALSFNLPSIASKIGGNPEVIDHNFNGLLVEYNNQKQIFIAIKSLWQNPDLAAKFIANSKDVLKQFTFEKMIEDYLSVLK
ncbi:MAG: glycosyltransferase family 4 protein [Candidatus Komeilibacteria bacterium]|nr:glycosyltransferase family 4 protein [Candidatus Komeilibacteria bacterium]